jgi:hypothetical protein
MRQSIGKTQQIPASIHQMIRSSQLKVEPLKILESSSLLSTIENALDNLLGKIFYVRNGMSTPWSALFALPK